MQRHFAVADDVGFVALGFEIEAEALREMVFVFDDEDPSHECSPTVYRRPSASGLEHRGSST